MSAAIAVVWGVIYNFQSNLVISLPAMHVVSSRYFTPGTRLLYLTSIENFTSFFLDLMLHLIFFFILMSKIYCHPFYQLLGGVSYSLYF